MKTSKLREIIKWKQFEIHGSAIEALWKKWKYFFICRVICEWKKYNSCNLDALICGDIAKRIGTRLDENAIWVDTFIML